ncbi:MAG: sulfite exporter TauE/SafE family protein [Proteobacteria bacterium]|nr:sulfite exporter TauE/SafE family protein [Desulfocapsa sp.]MBU3945673.1 sulfite exporter TauE/SafE family protein [Pseudomonadota bacterium]MCG2743616.1 sulfite exporter TauE/SafE family protein [Desulfobacteraceae bacterium]MBU4030279.1 sulfite exporter TauE/SafE family protein [Pseudomonadota bacterium]MBU4042870.1 sulfite exporter TauE/SafE family protein [Pseudomonadota bacterium]
MFFTTAGIEVAFWIPPLVAFVVSFFTSMGGISGAFLLLPFQMSFLGYTNPSVSATNQVFNIVAIPSGVYRYWREGRMVWPLTWIVILGTLPGVFIGAIVRVSYLPNPRHFKLFVAAVLLYIGFKMVRDLLNKNSRNGAKASSEKRFQEMVKSGGSKSVGAEISGGEHFRPVTITHFNLRRLGFTFHGESFDVSFWGIFLLSFIVGIVGGIYGIGGGSIIAPFFITFFGLPVYIVAGAALMGTFVTSVAGVAFYQAIAPFYSHLSVAPDWLLGILFGVGGMAGMYLGARCQKFVPAKAIKWMLAGIMVLTATKYILEFFGY